MTREDIIAMAQEARDQVSKELPPHMFDLDLFHERFVALVRADEREACAKLADKFSVPMCHSSADAIAAAIRARGQA